MHFSSIMGSEMPLSELYVGPYDGAQSRRYLVQNAPPLSSKQTKMKCNKCLQHCTSATTPGVRKTVPVSFIPRWVCHAHSVATSEDPCSSCPICSRDDGLTRRRVHMCDVMIANHEYTPVLLPCRMMLDYTRCGPGCGHCGFSLTHIVCECP